MNTASGFGSLALDRLKDKQQSAERVSSIELPLAVERLNTGSDFWVKAKRNRYLKLLRDGEITLNEMMMLVEMAKTRRNPAGWFANVMSKAKWTRTTDFLKKCREVYRKADEVAQRLNTSVNGFIIKQTWHHSEVLQYAIQAQELATNKLKYFAWLCTHSEAL